MTHAIYYYPIVFVALVLAAFIATRLYLRYALNKGVLDNPNERSSHQQPTPRGGGISIVLGFILVYLIGLSQHWLDMEHLLALLGAGIPIAIVGLIDDHTPLKSSTRLAVQVIGTSAGLLLLPQMPSLEIGNLHWQLDGWLMILPLLGALWLTNLYNFMDGIDGIASIEAITTLIGAALILIYHQTHLTALLMLLLCAPVAGFLILNWAPAKIFMGDSCSSFLGASFGILALITATTSELNLWCWMILLGTFIVDSTWTLLYRLRSGQNWHSPHRSHSYQILSRQWQSHAKVSSAAGILNLLWLTPWALAASLAPDYGLACLCAAYAPLVILCATCKAGHPSA